MKRPSGLRLRGRGWSAVGVAVPTLSFVHRRLVDGRQPPRRPGPDHAVGNIELNETAAASVPVLDRLTCPVRFVLATGDSLRSRDGETERGEPRSIRCRAGTRPRGEREGASNHSKTLRNDSPPVAQTIRELATTRGHAVG